jgi:tRNA A-37 threonylcarbamoyl transferase component Bud32
MSDQDDFYEDIPPWTVINLVPDDDSCEMTIMCSGKRFIITVSSGDLHDDNNDSILEDEFFRMASGLDDDPMLQSDLEGWMGEPCISYLKTLAPISDMPEPLTLQDYFVPPTFYFKLVNEHGKLTAIRGPDEYEPIVDASPKMALSQLPERVSRYPMIDAASIEIIQGNEWEDFGSSIPKKVLLEGRYYHFKPIQDSHSFQREVASFLKLESTRLSRHCRVSRLHGFVVYSNDRHTVMGMLLDYIDHDRSLADYFHSQSSNGDGSQTCSTGLLQRWMRQLQDTVDKLHRAGIIWGDVKPDNVLIDKDGNVWVVDFGGGYNSRWVDEDVMETVEGDLQGLSRMAEHVEQLGQGTPADRFEESRDLDTWS